MSQSLTLAWSERPQLPDAIATLLVEPYVVCPYPTSLFVERLLQIRSRLLEWDKLMGRRAPGGLSGDLKESLLYDRALAMELKRMELRFKDRNLMLPYVCMRLRDACFKRYGGEKVDGILPNA